MSRAMLLAFVLPARSPPPALTTATTVPLDSTPRLEPSPVSAALPDISALMPPLLLWSVLLERTLLVEPCLAALHVKLDATPELEPTIVNPARLAFPATALPRPSCPAPMATTRPTAP